MTGASKVNGQADLWEITVQPDSGATVTIMLSPTSDCDDQGALCTQDGQRLSAGTAFQVPGPPLPNITVQDAEANEDSDANIEFVVTLSPASAATVTVDYATEDGTATAAVDYTSSSGTLTFAPGDTQKTVSVPILDDTVEDDGETFKLVLSNASGATLSDAEAQGLIRNMEPEPVNSPATGAPTISGTAQVGQTLTASTSAIDDDDGMDNATLGYQWIAGTADISGATGSTHTLVSSDLGKTIRVRVSFTDDADNAETLVSQPTPAVAAEPVAASYPASAYMSTQHSGPEDHPQVVVAFSRAVEAVAANTPSASVTGATVSRVQTHEKEGLTNAWIFILAPTGNGDITFSLVADQPCASSGICAADGGLLASVPGTRTLTGPGAQQQDSGQDNQQQEPQQPPPKPTGLTATVNGNGTITLSWTATADSSVTGYQILRRRPFMGEGTLMVYVADTGSTSTSWTDTGTTSGTRHVYRVKAINGARLSSWSNYVNPTTP